MEKKKGKSKLPRKQRRKLSEAPQHARRKRTAAHYLGGERLAQEYKLKGRTLPRAIPIKKGDTVVIMRGDAEIKGVEAKVESVDPNTNLITLDGVVREKADKAKVARSVHASNVMILKADLSDPWRKKKIEKIATEGMSE